MNGSTRVCVTILNAFGAIALLLGAISIAGVFASPGERGASTLLALAPGLTSVLSGAILAGAAEALRLLSEINEGLKRTRTPQSRSARAA